MALNHSVQAAERSGALVSMAKSEAAPEISEYFIPDFSNWKDHDSYKTAFDRLLKDLKATGE